MSKTTVSMPKVVLSNSNAYLKESYENMITSIRECWDSFETASPENDRKLCENVIKRGHVSTIEHFVLHFKISDVSRALLQEFARHRIASLSVKSTRYTLKELKDKPSFVLENGEVDFDSASTYLVFTGNENVDKLSVLALENLRLALADGIPNDQSKFCMPEAYKCKISWTINARSLRNFLELRSSKAAMWEIRNLANAIYESIPEEYQFIFKDAMFIENKVAEAWSTDTAD